MSIEGTYNIVARGKEGKFIFNQEGDVLTGNIDAMGTEAIIENGTVDGNNYKFTVQGQSPMGKIKVTVKGSVDGDKISGAMKTSIMSVPFEGTRA